MLSTQKITVAIPVYNGQKYILEALHSIFDQTQKVDSIIVCDNHSTDDTVNIVNQIIDEHEEFNIKLYINDSNLGVIRNFNKCIELCTTDFLIILGVDDRLKPDTVKRHINVFKKMPELGMVGGIYDTINQDGETTNIPRKNETIIFEKGDILSFMKRTGFYMQHSTIMFNMKCTRNVGYYDFKGIAPDERFNVEHLVKYPIAQIREGITESRIHDNQVTNLERLRFEDKLLHFQANLDMAKYESTPLRRKELKNLLKVWIAAQCISIGRKVWKNYGEYGIALKYWNYGIKQNPNILIKQHFWRTIALSVLHR